MRTITVLLSVILFSPLVAHAQDYCDIRYVEKLYADRYCNRLTGNAAMRATSASNFQAFWEKELANSLYKKVIVLPPRTVIEGKAKKYSKDCKSPWYYVDPARSRQMTYLPSEVDEALKEQCLNNPVRAYFEAIQPFDICGGAADKTQRKFFTLHFLFSISAPDRQAMDAMNEGKAPLRMTIVHLKEMRLADHDIYIHLTGVQAPEPAAGGMPGDGGNDNGE